MVGRPPRAGVAIPNAPPCRVGLAVLMATALAALGHLASASLADGGEVEPTGLRPDDDDAPDVEAHGEQTDAVVLFPGALAEFAHGAEHGDGG